MCHIDKDEGFHLAEMNSNRLRMRASATHRVKILFAIVALILVILQCSDGMVEYSRKSEGFSIGFPKGWELRENVTGYQLPPNTRVLVVASPPIDPRSSFAENINVQVQVTDHQAYATAAFVSLVDFYSEGKASHLPPLDSLTLAGSPAVRFPLYFKQVGAIGATYVVARGNRVYIVQGTALEAKWKDFEVLLDKVALSLKLI